MPETSRATIRQHLQRAWLRRGATAWLLWPFSLLMRALVTLRRTGYQCGIFRSQSPGVPVIVVGNVVVGGAGKTPTVIAVVRHLQARGRHPGVISRGYGRTGEACMEVLHDSPARLAGDEPLLVRRSTGAPVFVAARRIEAAQVLLARHPQTDVLVCDDGLQHLALQRDIEICVFDERGVGNGFLLPAGPLRESWPRQVDIVLNTTTSTGRPPAVNGFTARRTLADHAVRADGRQIPLNQLRDVQLLALAGIARPQTFFDMLQSRGLVLHRTEALPDHFDFDSWKRPSDAGIVLVCTEKDAFKLWTRHPDAWAVPLVQEPEPAFFQALDQQLDAKLSSPHGHQTS